MNCKYCNKEFNRKSNKEFCSKKCSNAYWRKNFSKGKGSHQDFYQKQRGFLRKKNLIDKRGGCCERCGYNKCLAAICFHHLDPSTKSFDLDMRRLSNNSWNVIEEEFAKCIVLCHNCHMEEHYPDLLISEMESKYLYSTPEVDETRSICPKCGKGKLYSSSYCKNCDHMFRLGKKQRINWPTPEEILFKLESSNYTKLSLELGVSGNAIRKYLKKRIGYYPKREQKPIT